MSTLTRIMAAVVSTVFLLTPAAFAGGNLAKQKPIEVRLDMGKDGVGDHKFYPALTHRKSNKHTSMSSASPTVCCIV